MCHLLLVLPLLGLGVFWFEPFDVALPAYLVILAISLWFYVYVMRAMHRPAQIGAEQIVNGIGEVVSAEGTQLRVRLDSEMWSAIAEVSLQPGDRVRIIGLDGLTLHVAPVDDRNGAPVAHA